MRAKNYLKWDISNILLMYFRHTFITCEHEATTPHRRFFELEQGL